MPRSVSLHTMEEIDEEISRLMNRRRAYMNTLRFEERKGRELAAKGLTMENIEDRLAELDETAESLDE